MGLVSWSQGQVKRRGYVSTITKTFFQHKHQPTIQLPTSKFHSFTSLGTVPLQPHYDYDTKARLNTQCLLSPRPKRICDYNYIVEKCKKCRKYQIGRYHGNLESQPIQSSIAIHRINAQNTVNRVRAHRYTPHMSAFLLFTGTLASICGEANVSRYKTGLASERNLQIQWGVINQQYY